MVLKEVPNTLYTDGLESSKIPKSASHWDFNAVHWGVSPMEDETLYNPM